MPQEPENDPLPIALWTASLEGAFLSVEAWSVIVLRSLSMSGLRPMAPAEPFRMVVEKPSAFVASHAAAWKAAADGHRADQVASIYIRRLRQEVRANTDRLRSGVSAPPERARP
ncbi:MAG: antibiotic ABC transporter [Pseudomonadota bacterium]